MWHVIGIVALTLVAVLFAYVSFLNIRSALAEDELESLTLTICLDVTVVALAVGTALYPDSWWVIIRILWILPVVIATVDSLYLFVMRLVPTDFRKMQLYSSMLNWIPIAGPAAYWEARILIMRERKESGEAKTENRELPSIINSNNS